MKQSGKLSNPERFGDRSFDNQPIAEMIAPSLTTIEQPISLLGKRAMEVMLQLLSEENPEPFVEVLPFRLLIRGSTTAS